MTILAFDLGASSGRAYAGHVDGGLIKAEEIHRFPNQPVQAGKHLYWDILRLYHEIKQGILKAKTAVDESAASESIHGRLTSVSRSERRADGEPLSLPRPLHGRNNDGGVE
ncbi:hypothetical protein PO124_21170 [Bacillus licheniformis]|nr:hypothetical protein [Bacillus licheniformis]